MGEVLSGPYAGCKIVNGFYLRIPATLPHTVGSWYYNKFDWLDGLDKSSFKELTRVSKGPDVDAMANGTFIGGVGLGMLAGAASVRENYDVAFKNKQGKRMVVRLYSTSAYQHLLTKVY